MKSGMYIDSHLERCVLVQAAELYTSGKYLNWNFKNLYYGPTLAISIVAISHTIHMGHIFKFQFGYFPEVYNPAV